MPVVQKLRCRVERVTAHGDHVYTVELVPGSAVPRFRAGQFLHLALDEYDPGSFWPDSRVFSIASAPAEKDRLRICYSVRGRFTQRMEAELAEGRGVWVKLPYGDFLVDGARPAVLYAGGTGITAFINFVASLEPAHAAPVVLAYGARRTGLLVFRDIFERQAAAVPRFRLCLFSEQPAPGVEIGCVSVARAWSESNGAAGALHYLSGPPAMIKVLSAELARRGVPASGVRVDAWE
jgi:ferredoxin-NADP reductase